MSVPEQTAAPQSSNNLSDSQIHSEMDVFCRVMGRLNAVALGQIKGLLEIAVTAAEKIHSGGSASNPAPAANSNFVNQAKENIENLNRDSREALKNISASTGEGSLPPRIEQALGMAVDNSVANQQQLNIIGAALLTEAVSRLIGKQPAE